MREAAKPEEVFLNVAEAQELFKNFHEFYRFYIDKVGIQTDKALDLNKQQVASYERLLLIDVGTIGLSVTAFMSLAGKLSPSLARYPLIGIVVLAWFCLFVSGSAFLIAINQMIRANAHLVSSWGKIVDAYNAQVLGVSVQKLANALSGSVNIDGDDHDVKVLFRELSSKLHESSNELRKERQEIIEGALASLQAPISESVLRGHRFMRYGFILLGMAAVVGFLAAKT